MEGREHPKSMQGLTPKIHSGMDPDIEYSYSFLFPPALEYLKPGMLVDALSNAFLFKIHFSMQLQH